MKFAILVLLLLPAPLLAQQEEPEQPEQAKLVLDAPDTAKVGELIRFNVSDSVADSFKWIVTPETSDFLVYDEGARAVFSARTSGEYRFIVACAKGGSVDVVTHVIRVIGPPPRPTSDDIAEWIPVWVWTAGLSSEEARTVADVFEEVAKIRPETPEEWVKMTAEANQKALGDHLDAWVPVLDKIGKALHSKAVEGVLTTPEEHATAWLKVAKALRKS